MGESTKKQTEVINQQIKDLVGIYRTVVGRLGMSENEFWIWYALIVMGGSYTQQDICLMWSLSKQTVNTIISNMVRKGYASLEAIPGTRNRKEIHLTETGKAYGEQRPAHLRRGAEGHGEAVLRRAAGLLADLREVYRPSEGGNEREPVRKRAVTPPWRVGAEQPCGRAGRGG